MKVSEEVGGGGAAAERSCRQTLTRLRFWQQLDRIILHPSEEGGGTAAGPDLHFTPPVLQFSLHPSPEPSPNP